MRNRTIRIAAVAIAFCGLVAIGVSENATDSGSASARLCDRVWVWGNTEMAKAGIHSVVTSANAGHVERATFPGYAQFISRSASGTVLCGYRYPLYSVNVNRDNGLNRDEGTVVDFPVWAMGTMLEIEPDVVLCTHTNARRNLPLLARIYHTRGQ